MQSAGLHRWLNDCQLDSNHEYYTGWADSRDFLIELATHYPAFDFSILETYMMTTPPPSSEIPMPVVAARSHFWRVAFVENWLVMPYFTVSVSREFRRPLLWHGFVQPIGADQPWLLRDLPQHLRYLPVTGEALQFTGAVDNRHMLFALFRLLESHKQEEKSRT